MAATVPAVACLWCETPLWGVDGYLVICGDCRRWYETAAVGMPVEEDVPDTRVPDGLCRSGCGRLIAVGRRRFCGECGNLREKARRATMEARRVRRRRGALDGVRQ